MKILKTVGKYTYELTPIKTLDSQSNLIIGKYCSISSGVTVFLGAEHRTDWITTFAFGHREHKTFPKCGENINWTESNGDVIIGNDVWIGRNVTIMSGIKIGDGAVIAANAHVVSNVKPYAVVGGNPAVFYYSRFNADVIKKLLELKWWDLDDTIINEISPLLCSNNFDLLFETCEKLKNG